MGVSMVCCVGSCFSMYLNGSGRCHICQASVIAHYAGMVYETRWAVACLRMEFQRCKSACTCMGGAAGLFDRKKAKRCWRPGFFKKDISKTADQFYLVDKPEG